MKKKLWVGIDVSKEWIDLIEVNEKGDISKQSKRFDNNFMSFALMTSKLSKDYRLKKTEMMFCFEYTGRYSKKLAEFFSEYGYDYSQIPGLEIKLSQGMRRGTTDQDAARQIALYAYKNRKDIRLNKSPEKSLQALADLLAYRTRLKKAIHSFEVSAKLLEEFPLNHTDQAIEQRSRELINRINKELSEVERHAEELIPENASLNMNHKLLTSVKGIGLWTSAYMLIYTENFKKFDGNWRKFACYAATAPFENSSGKKKGKAKTTKMGCKSIKSLLTMCARSAMLYDMQIRAFAERKLAEGKPYHSVVNAVKNKLIARMFAVVNRQTPYVELMP